uniref:Monoglyceride lipase n=1 Tax=Caligus clemensi TaxID=344056 RepID=C1C0Q0_CALCM|nr:Monoglyceride lipase [Caligus clemensi]
MSNIKEEFSTLEGPHGHKLHAVRWSPSEADLKGLVYLCHGYDEHIQYYKELGVVLAEKGYLAFGHDHPGHGQSSGPILQSDCFENDYADNVIFDCELKMKEFENSLPLFIIGHSMGGLITCRVLIKKPGMFKAAVLMGAALQMPPETVTPLKVSAVKFINYIYPKCPVGKLSVNEVTRDQKRLTIMKNDALRGRSFNKAGFVVAFLEEINMVTSKLSEINLPVLIQHGEKDSIIPSSASELIFEAISSTQKSKHIYTEAFHCLYQELPEVRAEAIQEAVQWILDHH